MPLATRRHDRQRRAESRTASRRCGGRRAEICQLSAIAAASAARTSAPAAPRCRIRRPCRRVARRAIAACRRAPVARAPRLTQVIGGKSRRRATRRAARSPRTNTQVVTHGAPSGNIRGAWGPIERGQRHREDEERRPVFGQQCGRGRERPPSPPSPMRACRARAASPTWRAPRAGSGSSSGPISRPRKL